MRRQWLAEARRQRLQRFRDAQLRRVIEHAYARVPYYRELFDRHRIRPADVRAVEDLQGVPMTTRAELQAQPADAIVAHGLDPRRLIVRGTSGSSGRPLLVRRTWLEERLLGAVRWRALRALGLRPTDRHVDISLIRTHPNDDRRIHRGLELVGLFRQQRIQAFQEPEAIARALRVMRPDVVTGVAGVLTRVADALATIDGPTSPVRFVAGHSETLTPAGRLRVHASFKAPAYELYDCHECNLIAWECPRSGELHTCDESVIVEVLAGDRPVAPGERGAVVLTSLRSFAMPIIRYHLGDVVTRGRDRCACGAPFATLRAVQGRILDYFPLPDGRLLYPSEVIPIVEQAGPWIREYQVTQERRDLVVLRAVAPVAPAARERAALHARVAAVLGPAVTLRIDLVAELRPEASAKFRLFHSRVTSAVDGERNETP